MMACMVLWLGLVGAVVYLYLREPDPATQVHTTDPARYVVERERWGNASLTRHFPKKIPADARDVRFSVMHPTLQPRGWIRVSFTVTEAAAQSERLQHCSHATRVLRTTAEVDRLRRETAAHLADGDERGDTGAPRMRRSPEMGGASFCICVLVDESFGKFGHSAGLTVEPESGRLEYWAFVW